MGIAPAAAGAFSKSQGADAALAKTAEPEEANVLSAGTRAEARKIHSLILNFFSLRYKVGRLTPKALAVARILP